MSHLCHYCGEPGAERFNINGKEQYFHANLLRDCLNESLKEEQELWFKERGVAQKSRGEKFSTVRRL